MNNTPYTFGTYFKVQPEYGAHIEVFVVASPPLTGNIRQLFMRVSTGGGGWLSATGKDSYKEMDLDGKDFSLAEALEKADKFLAPVRSIAGAALKNGSIVIHPFYFPVTFAEYQTLVDGKTPETLINNTITNADRQFNTVGIYDSQISLMISLNKEIRNLKEISILFEPIALPVAVIAASISSKEVFKALQSRETNAPAIVSITQQPDEPPVDLTVTYTRPNGEIYYPRKWDNKTDVEVLQIARQNQLNPFLTGAPGTGKTALCEAAFGAELITVVISGDTEVSDLIGGYVPDGDTFTWVDGPVLVAVKEGRPLLLDEIALGDPKVLSTIYALMDGRNEINVTSNPQIGVVKAQPGFFVLGATNPKAPGARMSEALLSRFSIHVEVTTDWVLVSKLNIPNKIVTIAQALSRRYDEGDISWAPQFRELIQYKKILDIYGEKFALANLLAICPEDDRETVQEVVKRVFLDRTSPARI